MKRIATLSVAIVGMLAIVKIADSTYQQAKAAPVSPCVQAFDAIKDNSEKISSEFGGPIEGQGPIGPIRTGTQYQVTCASIDAGTTTTSLLSPDGGIDIETDSIYVAPKVGSSVKVRVGFGAALTSASGFEVGTNARDGPGVSIDTTKSPFPRCKSEGAAQLTDVIVGRQ